MKCPYCDAPTTGVKDKRNIYKNTKIRRRRVCYTCNRRFTSYEKIDFNSVDFHTNYSRERTQIMANAIIYSQKHNHQPIVDLSEPHNYDPNDRSTYHCNTIGNPNERRH